MSAARVPVRLVTRAGTVLVTGATGRVGRLVVDELLLERLLAAATVDDAPAD